MAGVYNPPAETAMIKVAIYQWIKKGYRKDRVRQATHPKANPPNMVDKVSIPGLPRCATAKGTA
jgi:hypothetical protein